MQARRVPAAATADVPRPRHQAADTHADLIARARLAFEQTGPGVVVKLLEDGEPRYSAREEIEARLVEEKADPALLVAVLRALNKNDPKWQAVYLLERKECITVSIVGNDRSEVVENMTGRR